MEIASLAIAIMAIAVAVLLHIWARVEQRQLRRAAQEDIAKVNGAISDIRSATEFANHLAEEALEEAKKAHTQRAAQTEHQLAQTLLPRIAELDKDAAQTCYEIGTLDLTNPQKHRLMALKGQEDVVFAVRALKAQYLAGKASPQVAESELQRIGELYDELVAYLKAHKR